MATLQSGKCFTVPTFFGMCCSSEWQKRMYIYKWHEVDQTKHEIFCVHIVCNEIQVKVNLEITTFFFYLRFPYCPNFFWFGVVLYYISKHWHFFQGILERWDIQVATSSYWGASGLSSWPTSLLCLHGIIRFCHSETWLFISLLCWWHSTLPFIPSWWSDNSYSHLSMSNRHFLLDEEPSPSAQPS